jgi:hypothetical protein
MKHAHTLKRAMAVLLALVMTLSLVTPTWAMSSSSVATKGENNGITWEKVDNIKLPIKENAAVEEEAQQQYADTDVVRVSIVLRPLHLGQGLFRVRHRLWQQKGDEVSRQAGIQAG